MPTLSSILNAIDSFAPFAEALPNDKVGLLVGDPQAEVHKAVVALDRSHAAIRFAQESGAQLLVSHHPLFWEPLNQLVFSDYDSQAVRLLVESKIALIASHTNWDCALGGVNDVLTSLLELEKIEVFGQKAVSRELKLVTFVPDDNLEQVVDALSLAGAGVIGKYRRCAFFSPGTGTFLADENANPVIGKVGQIEKVEEVRLEMILPEVLQEKVCKALLAVHPYEEPAFDFYRLVGGNATPIGRVGMLKVPQKLSDYVKFINEKLNSTCVAWGDPEQMIQHVAVIGGAADGEWRAARDVGADLLVTGEVRHHVSLEASESGFALVAAGHFATENPSMFVLRDRLAASVPAVQWLVYEPRRGESGRPIR